MRKRWYLSQLRKLAVKKAFGRQGRFWNHTDWVQPPMPFLTVWPHTSPSPSLRLSFWLCKMGIPRKEAMFVYACVSICVYSTLHRHTLTQYTCLLTLPWQWEDIRRQFRWRNWISYKAFVLHTPVCLGSGVHINITFIFKKFLTHLLAAKQPHFTLGEHASW